MLMYLYRITRSVVLMSQKWSKMRRWPGFRPGPRWESLRTPQMMDPRVGIMGGEGREKGGRKGKGGVEEG